MSVATIRRSGGAGDVVVGAIGDSITAGTPHWDPDPEIRARMQAADERHAWPYWAAQGNRRVELRVSAADGERTDQIAARLDQVAAGIDALVVQGGINDLVQGRTPESAADGIRQLLGQARDLELPVLVANVLPWNNGYPDHEAPIRRLNALIAELALAFDATLLDFYAVLEDPERPGRMRSDWTTDGSHPSVAGHRRLGESAFRLPPSLAAET